MCKEEWKEVDGYNGNYLVSNTGKVKSLKKKSPYILSGSFAGDYRIVGIYKGRKRKYTLIHRLVAEAFVPNPDDKPCVNHIDGDKTNNMANNLQWCTHSENTAHAYNNGLMSNVRGESHGRSKLTKNDVLQIRSVYDQGWFDIHEIAESYNVSSSAIHHIISKYSWRHI